MTSTNRLPRVLYLCTGNSCRSQMAEGLLRNLAGARFEALSAGTHPVGVNPRAVAAMNAIGIDISAQRSKSIDDFLSDPPDYVVTVCDRARESCPTFPGVTQLVRWSFDDPADATGSDEEIMAEFARVRDEIRASIERWLETHVESGSSR